MAHSILVTGGTGFIGRYTLAELTSRGHDTHVLMRRPERLPQLKATVDRLGGDSRRLKATPGDLSLPDFGQSTAHPHSLAHVDRVLHLGALFDWKLTRDQAYRTNTLGSLQLVEWCARQDADLITVSGFMAHNPVHLARLGIDPTTGDANWTDVYRKAGAYEASKMEAHFKTLEAARRLSVPLTVVSPGTVAGHSTTGDLPSGQPFSALIRNLIAGRMAAVPGSDRHWLPVIAVDTLAGLLCLAVEDRSMRGEAIVALDPDTPPLPFMLRELAASLDIRPPRIKVPKRWVELLLRLPGMETLMGTPREALDFIQTERFDTSPLKAVMDRHSLAMPDVRQVLRATAQHVQAEPEPVGDPSPQA